MHIADGILTPEWCILWYALAAVFVAIGAIQISRKRKINPTYMSLVGLMGAAVFVISVWHIPVPVTGSCSHPVGTPLSRNNNRTLPNRGNIRNCPLLPNLHRTRRNNYNRRKHLLHGNSWDIYRFPHILGIKKSWSIHLAFSRHGRISRRPHDLRDCSLRTGNLNSPHQTWLSGGAHLPFYTCQPRFRLPYWSLDSQRLRFNILQIIDLNS